MWLLDRGMPGVVGGKGMWYGAEVGEYNYCVEGEGEGVGECLVGGGIL